MPLATTITECQNDGRDAKIYYSLSGDCANPVYTLHVGIIGDLNIGDTSDENQVNRRDSNTGIKSYNPGDADVNITGTQIVDGNYQGFAVLTRAKKGGTPVYLLILSGPVTEVNAIGYRGKWWNFDRSISMPSEGEQEASFSLKPAACSDCPVRAVKVAVSGTAADWDQSIVSS